MIEIDNKRVRRSNRCPLCGGYKEMGLVACWPCYRSRLKDGDPEAEAIIEKANDQIEQEDPDYQI